jgi:hypothetical protein
MTNLSPPTETLTPARVSGGLGRTGAIGLQIGLLVATVAIFDTVAFYTLSDDMEAALPGYREGYYVPDFFGRGYPKDYYVANADRGFDIAPTDTPRTDQWHYLDDVDVRYQLWSNNLGCFDTPHPNPAPNYVYFAGDSVTWGYAPFETKFGTIFEKETGIETFKCGVTHSGTRHEFSKFLEIGQKVGRWPAKVAVFYSPTDVANDYLHPHSTVVDHGLADKARLDIDNNVVHLDESWFEMIRERIKTAKAGEKGLNHILLQYSFTTQLVNAGLYWLKDSLPWIASYIPTIGDQPFLHWADKYEVYKGQKTYDLHRMTYLGTNTGIYEYKDFPYAEPNKKVIAQWKEHADKNHYDLIFFLLPAGQAFFEPDNNTTVDFYGELKAYLEGLGIRYVDLGKELRDRKIGPEAVYWPDNSHFSIDGNIIVGEMLPGFLITEPDP